MEGLDKTAGEKIGQLIIDKVLELSKQNKSPSEDGIISEFYMLYWDIIKDDFFSFQCYHIE